jgi:cob(I)alamin adenosyltransferase
VGVPDLVATEAVARAAWDAARKVISSDSYDMVVLDKVTYPLNWGWIPADEVVRTIADRPEHVNIIATGRDASPELITVADTVTEMVAVRHAYDLGIGARRGIEY